MSFNSIAEIIDDIRSGRMVILIDDEDRENEGDLVMAASRVRPEDINFMARYGRGLICITLTRERCRQLHLPLMVSENNTKNKTNFTVSIEAAQGVSTGISAADRATTIQAAVAKNAKPTDLIQPGHIFPLMAQPGGVLTRAGHTEAGCDLALLAGLEPASVIVEILNEDGSMARRPELEQFARTHGLKIGTIADLIHYRLENEKTVTRVAECSMSTPYGMFELKAYQDIIDNQLHLALVHGELRLDQPVLVRVHVEDPLWDILNARREDSGWLMSEAMQRVADEGRGIIVVLRNSEGSETSIGRIMDYHQRDEGKKIIRTINSQELRTYGVGAQILVDLGVKQMRVLGTPKKLLGISGFGLEIVEYIQD
jgi:3,4-dihydroxy 2-butanone 4-phosphate synthase / GTP cyclohydrolase II